MFKFHNWRTRMCAPDAGGAAGAQAPGSNAAPAGSQQSTAAQQTQQPVQGQQVPQGDAQSQQPLTPEQRHTNAARRRADEDRELQELRAFKANAERVAQSRKFKDFSEMASFNDNDLIRKGLKEGTLDADTLRLVMQPVVQQTLQPILDAQSGELQQRDVQDELVEFNKLYGEEGIKEITDFKDKPYLPKMREYIDKGLTLVEAYELANRDALRGKQSAAAKQQAINMVNGKAHMAPVAGGPEGLDTTVVPAEVYANYRRMNPRMSDEQIRKHYRESMKGS